MKKDYRSILADLNDTVVQLTRGIQCNGRLYGDVVGC